MVKSVLLVLRADFKPSCGGLQFPMLGNSRQGLRSSEHEAVCENAAQKTLFLHLVVAMPALCCSQVTNHLE